eukprot:scaffold161544_cov35-Tisochrysis_lutea.AAC.4
MDPKDTDSRIASSITRSARLAHLPGPIACEVHRIWMVLGGRSVGSSNFLERWHERCNLAQKGAPVEPLSECTSIA